MAGPPPVGHGKPGVREDLPVNTARPVPNPTEGGEGGATATPPDLSRLPSGWNQRPFRTSFPMEETIVQGGRQTTSRTVPFTNTQLIPKLTKLLGNGFGDAIRKKTEFETSHTVKTPHGPLEVKVLYRPQDNDIFFTLSDTQTTGTSCRIKLDNNGSPIELSLMDYRNNFFPRVFVAMGIEGVSQAVLGIDDAKVWDTESTTAFLTRVDLANLYDDVARKLQELRDDPKKRTSVRVDYYGPDTGVFVQQNGYQVASIETPLATAGLNTCSALIVIDPKGRRHYLAHVDSRSTADQIAKSVRDSFSNLEGLEVYVMEEYTRSGTLAKIYTALKNMGLEENLKFIPNPGFMSPGIGTQNGEMFNPTITFQKKSAEPIAK